MDNDYGPCKSDFTKEEWEKFQQAESDRAFERSKLAMSEKHLFPSSIIIAGVRLYFEAGRRKDACFSASQLVKIIKTSPIFDTMITEQTEKTLREEWIL